MKFEELNPDTRKSMLEEFKKEEQSKNPYRSESMTTEGLSNVAQLVEKSIKNGNEETLATDLSMPKYWKSHTTVHRASGSHQRRINPETAAGVFGLTEFNTWYVGGLAKKLMSEGIDKCEIYRAESAKEPRCECLQYEGKQIEVQKIYDGHRTKYHPKKNSSAFSIPSGPNCHHSIRRIKKK